MDAERFACVLEQYPTSIPNRRLMYIDRLLREMPHKTRTEIVSMGSPHSAYPIPSQFTMHTLYVTGCPGLPASFLSFHAGLEIRNRACDYLSTSKYTGNRSYGVVVVLRKCYNQLCYSAYTWTTTMNKLSS